MESGYNKTQIENIFKKPIIQSNDLAIKLEQILQNPPCYWTPRLAYL